MSASRVPAAAPERAPSVLVVLTVRDGAGWLRECLVALSAQTYPRIGIVAVDDASIDGSAEILTEALGEQRVIRLPERRGRAACIRAALDIPAASEADQLLLLHDDAVMDPDAVQRLVEAAIGISGLDNVGIAGAKIVDQDEPRLLRDVGRSADRFGHPYSPLQPGEIDQGQFDRVLEVLAVSSCAMLVSREALGSTGLFDDRIGAEVGELDLGWRTRIAGFRVLMTPLARVRHGGDADREQRRHRNRHGPHYLEDRAAITAMLKNYRLLSLLWLLPVSLILGLLRLVYLVLARRFEDAYDLLASWGWNLVHLPGTLLRRRRAQRIRRAKDRALRRFLGAPGLRMPRWFRAAEQILEEQREIEEMDADVGTGRRLRDQTTSLLGAHPVLVASMFGLLVGVVAVRAFIGPEPLAGGVLPVFPARPSGFLAELVSGFRTTGLGGTLSASPGLAAFAGLSWASFASTAIAQKVILIGAPALAVVLLYRAAARLTSRPGPAVLAAAAFGLSGLMLWSLSQGRLDLLVALAVLPAAAERTEVAFGKDRPADGLWRFVAGVGVTLAVLVAFFPGGALAVAVLVAIGLLFGRRRFRGLGLTLAGALAAAVLLFPFIPTLVAGRGAAFGSLVGTTDLSALARLAPTEAPGSWGIALFLPIGALLSFALVGPEHRMRAVRAMLAALAGLALSWLAAAGWLPASLSDPLAYLALAAVGEALLLAYGAASIGAVLRRGSFGLRRIGSGVLVAVLAAGIVLQAAAAMVGGWSVGGPEQVPDAWAVLEGEARGSFNVLWIGGDTGRPFPAPGGDPEGLVPGGDATIRYAITDRGGTSALDLGRALTGPGNEHLRSTLGDVVAGGTAHGGALLAPFGIRFLVAETDDLPEAVAHRLDAQLDLDLLPAAGLVIYRNAVALPPAAVLAAEGNGEPDRTVLADPSPGIAGRGPIPSSPLGAVTGGWAGEAEDPGLAFVATEFSGEWRLAGSDAVPERAFGWATALPGASEQVRITFDGQLQATVAAWVLALAWAVALWVTRKPVSR